MPGLADELSLILQQNPQIISQILGQQMGMPPGAMGPNVTDPNTAGAALFAGQQGQPTAGMGYAGMSGMDAIAGLMGGTGILGPQAPSLDELLAIVAATLQEHGLMGQGQPMGQDPLAVNKELANYF